jgi:hypothetical protein
MSATACGLLVDVDYAPVPIEPRCSPLTGEELDMSLCALRSPSPIHTQYLKNMGVGATLVISLVAGDRLWGLIACHHCAPRFVPYQVRAQCELLGEVVATRIAALESVAQAGAELLVRRLEQRMIEAISRDGDWKAALFESPQSLLQPVQATVPRCCSRASCGPAARCRRLVTCAPSDSGWTVCRARAGARLRLSRRQRAAAAASACHRERRDGSARCPGSPATI